MTGHLLDTEARLTALFTVTARGPKRNGIFALWLLVRACDGLLPPNPLSAKAHRRRLQGLERRMSSLSLPTPIQRALVGSIGELGEGSSDAARLALQQLVAPAREAVSAEVGSIIARAAQRTRRAMKEIDSGAPSK